MLHPGLCVASQTSILPQAGLSVTGVCAPVPLLTFRWTEERNCGVILQHANARLVRFNATNRGPPQESLLAVDSNGKRCGLPGCARLLGLHCSCDSVFCRLLGVRSCDHRGAGLDALLL